MDAQRTPDALSTQAENELICEKLLGWIRHNYPANDSPAWEVPSKAGEFQPTVFVTPSFTTWAEAGLILEALAAQWPKSKDMFRGLGGSMCLGGITPSEIRDAALEYIRSLP